MAIKKSDYKKYNHKYSKTGAYYAYLFGPDGYLLGQREITNDVDLSRLLDKQIPYIRAKSNGKLYSISCIQTFGGSQIGALYDFIVFIHTDTELLETSFQFG